MAHPNFNRPHQQWPGHAEPAATRIGREAVTFIIVIYVLMLVARCES
jgi:hypothetical protein